jgi:hypothetical protein
MDSIFIVALYYSRNGIEIYVHPVEARVFDLRKKKLWLDYFSMSNTVVQLKYYPYIKRNMNIIITHIYVCIFQGDF